MHKGSSRSRYMAMNQVFNSLVVGQNVAEAEISSTFLKLA